MIKFSFRLENYEKTISDFAAYLNCSVKDHMFSVPPSLGKGTILANSVGPYLSYAVLNLKLDTDLELDREANGLKGFTLSFNQVDVQKEIRVSEDQSITADKRTLRNDIYVSDTRDSHLIKIPAGSSVKRL